MTVRFEKTRTNQCQVTAWAHERKPFAVSHMAGVSRIPHDLATFLIERELSINGVRGYLAHRLPLPVRPTEASRSDRHLRRRRP